MATSAFLANYASSEYLMACLVSLLLLLSYAHVAAAGDTTSSSGGGGGGGQADQACVTPLESLLDCLPYAQGKTALPTPTCCENMDKVYQSQKKCLCELIAASFDGGIAGLPPFNRTLAFHMPSACNIPADPSKCPGLLGIPSSSPEAKEFSNASEKPNGTSTPPKNTTPSSATLSMKSNDVASILSTSFTMKSLVLLVCYIQRFW